MPISPTEVHGNLYLTVELFKTTLKLLDVVSFTYDICGVEHCESLYVHGRSM